MKRYRTMILAAAVALALLAGPWPGLGPGPVQAQSIRYWWDVVNEYAIPYPQGTVTCSVYDPARDGAAAHVFTTVNSPTTGTTSALLGNRTGVFEFFWTDTTSTFDVICWSRAGNRAARMAITANVHRILMDRPGARRISRIPFHTNSGYITSEVVIPQGGVIRDVLIQNLNPIVQGNPHLNVGFAGNHAVGTIHAMVNQLALTGADRWIRPHATISTEILSGNPRIQCFSASHRGGALQIFESGCGAKHYGLYMEVPYQVHVAGGLTVTYQTSAVAGLGGHIYIIWDQLHLGAGRWGTNE